jgi:hypothetical protein
MKLQVRSVCLVLAQNPASPVVNCSSFSPFPPILEVIKAKDEFIEKVRVLPRTQMHPIQLFGVKYVRSVFDTPKDSGCG